MRIKLFALIFLILIGAGLTGWGVNNYLAWRQGEKLRAFQTDVENLFVALQKYKERMGSYPSGSNADIANALSGKNARGVIVVVSNRIPINEKGEFVDPWGTPLSIYFAGNSVLVRSAGANRTFEDSRVKLADDLVFAN